MTGILGQYNGANGTAESTPPSADNLPNSEHSKAVFEFLSVVSNLQKRHFAFKLAAKELNRELEKAIQAMNDWRAFRYAKRTDTDFTIEYTIDTTSCNIQIGINSDGLDKSQSLTFILSIDESKIDEQQELIDALESEAEQIKVNAQMSAARRTAQATITRIRRVDQHLNAKDIPRIIEQARTQIRKLEENPEIKCELLFSDPLVRMEVARSPFVDKVIQGRSLVSVSTPRNPVEVSGNDTYMTLSYDLKMLMKIAAYFITSQLHKINMDLKIKPEKDPGVRDEIDITIAEAPANGMQTPAALPPPPPPPRGSDG